VIICSDSIRRRDRVLGFKLGATDYITKPFDREEFLARVEAALRNTGTRGTRKPPAAPAQPPQPAQERVGELVIDRGRRRVTLGGNPINVTPTEYRLLCALAAEPGEVVSREQLAEQVWGYADASVGRTIDSHMMRLRNKLRAGTVPAPSIVSVRGFGYKMGPDVAAAPRRAAAPAQAARPHRAA
jgi:DNA-binding response OmpR family regulator